MFLQFGALAFSQTLSDYVLSLYDLDGSVEHSVTMFIAVGCLFLAQTQYKGATYSEFSFNI